MNSIHENDEIKTENETSSILNGATLSESQNYSVNKSFLISPNLYSDQINLNDDNTDDNKDQFHIDLDPLDSNNIRNVNSSNKISNIVNVIRYQPVSMWKCIHIGIAFFFVFAGYSPTQNIITNIHPNDGALGLGVLYAFFAFGSLVAPIVARKLGIILSLTLAALTYALFVFSAMDVFKSLFIPASALIGFGAGVLWSTQPIYLNRISPSEKELGKYSGIFQSLNTAGNIVGNAITGTMTRSKSISINTILIILGTSSLLGTAMLAFLRKAPSKSNEEPQPLSQMIKGIKDTFIDKRFHFIIPLTILQGQSQAYFYETLPTMIGLTRIGYIMVVFGVISIFASNLWGKLIDTRGKSLLIKILALLVLASLIISLLVSLVDNIMVFYIITIINGAYDCLQTMLLFTLVASTFKDNIFAFAASRVFQSLFTAIGFFVFPYLKIYIILLWLGLLSLCMLISLLYLIQGLEKGKWSNNENSIGDSFQKLQEEPINSNDDEFDKI